MPGLESHLRARSLTSYPANLLTCLREARRVAILSGAGVSAESGIATFRDKLVGLWEQYDPSELATPDAFDRDADLVWGWYEWRRRQVLQALPNAAHRAIAAMSTLVPYLTLVTQNVDDLHERAGSAGVLHLHGELAQPYCEACRAPHSHPQRMPQLPTGGTRIAPPRCGACGARVRPGVVWFGENLPERAWTAARSAVQECEVFFCVGSSAIVQPAASLIDLARNVGAITIQVNANPTEIDDVVSFSLRGRAGEILPALVDQAWPSAR